MKCTNRSHDYFGKSDCPQCEIRFNAPWPKNPMLAYVPVPVSYTPAESESEVQQQIQIEAAKYGCLLMRNNSGAFTDESGRSVRYGLGNISKKQSEELKSSDLIGITTITITPEMVGTRVGIFTVTEVKKAGWSSTKKLDAREQAQSNFIELIKSRGGIGGFANSVDSFLKILLG